MNWKVPMMRTEADKYLLKMSCTFLASMLGITLEWSCLLSVSLPRRQVLYKKFNLKVWWTLHLLIPTVSAESIRFFPSFFCLCFEDLNLGGCILFALQSSLWLLLRVYFKWHNHLFVSCWYDMPSHGPSAYWVFDINCTVKGCSRSEKLFSIEFVGAWNLLTFQSLQFPKY